MKKLLLISLFSYLSVALANDARVLESNSAFQKSLVKQAGFYRSLGFYTGYYHYGEVDRGGGRVMRMDTAMLGFLAQLGGISQSGLKLESTFRINYALGVYTGSILDADDDSRDGTPAKNITAAVAGDIELKAGYGLIRAESSNLFLQSGLGYHLNRTEFMPAERIQGYFYVPLEIDGEVAISNGYALSYGVGYRYLIFGNHFTAASKYGFTDDLKTTQKKGFGASAFIGLNYFSEDNNLRQVKLVYEYWSIEGSNPLDTRSFYTNNPVSIYEPKNATHRVFIQYHFAF